jgi:hypothetical protein
MCCQPQSDQCTLRRYEVRLTLQQILANTQKIDHSLDDQRHVLFDAHKRISSVTKGSAKPAR